MKDKAILVVSFGTSYDATRAKTIDVVEQKVKEAFSEYTVRRAFTSGIILKVLQKRGIYIHNVSEALEALVQEGIKEVYVLPTHLIPGDEYDKLVRECEAYNTQFVTIKIAEPLITRKEDFFNVAHAVAQYYQVPKEQALILMGHGSGHVNNNVYPAMDYVFKDLGYANIFVGTVEGYPEIDNLIQQVKKAGYTEGVLAPFMLVAGDHAEKDMASDEEDSWKTLLIKEGINVVPQLIGMGEIEGIQTIYLKHLKAIII